MAKKAPKKPKPPAVSPVPAQTARAAAAARRQAEEGRQLIDGGPISLRRACDAIASMQRTAKADPAAAAIFAQYGLSHLALEEYLTLTEPLFNAFPIA